jgi:hypothetical protein
MTRKRLDTLGRRMNQLMREIGERTCSREILADDRNIRILRRPLGMSETVESLTCELKDRIGPRAIALLSELDLDVPDLVGHEAPPSNSFVIGASCHQSAFDGSQQSRSTERCVMITMKSTLLMAVLAGLMLCGCGAQKPLQVGACDTHRQGAALVTRYVVVYGSRTAAPAITTLYACQRPGGEALRIGIDELGSVYGSDATTGSLRAAGTYVAAQSSTGEATLSVRQVQQHPALSARAALADRGRHPGPPAGADTGLRIPSRSGRRLRTALLGR